MPVADCGGAMPFVQARVPRAAGLLSVALLVAPVVLAGCAHEPAFRAALPEQLDRGGRSIAIVADLQLTSGVARFVRRREDNKESQRLLLDDLEERMDEIGALVIVGDLVFSGRSDRDWEHLDSLIADIAARVPVLAAMGNHDYPCWLVELCRDSAISKGMLARFPWLEPGRPYAVPSNGLELLFLDTESQFEMQGQWLATELERASARGMTPLVFFHRPAYTNSLDRGAVGSPEAQEFFVPALRAAAKPVIVVSGHVHGFEYLVRDDIHYLTTAGGGGPRGPLAEQRPDDRYRGPDCEREKQGDVVRPFNYLLLSETPAAIEITVRGFCGNGDSVRELDRFAVPR
jgi:hypothetical protein